MLSTLNADQIRAAMADQIMRISRGGVRPSPDDAYGVLRGLAWALTGTDPGRIKQVDLDFLATFHITLDALSDKVPGWDPRQLDRKPLKPGVS
jgi:hypothetical protein